MTTITIRSINHFRFFPQQLDSIVKSLQAQGLAKGFILYGSMLRSLWTKEKWNDINIAYQESKLKVENKLSLSTHGTSYSIDYNSSPIDILKKADFTVCQAVYHERKLFYADSFFEHLVLRKLIVDHSLLHQPLMTLLRVYKYLAKGFTIDRANYFLILKDINPEECGCISNEDISRHSGGVVVPSAYSCDSRFMSEPELHFPALKKAGDTVRSLLDLKDGEVSSLFLYGNFIWSQLNREPYKEINIAVSNELDWSVIMKKQNALGVQIMNTDEHGVLFNNRICLSKTICKEYRDLLPRLDFMNTQLAIDLVVRKIYYSSSLFQHANQKMLVRNPYYKIIKSSGKEMLWRGLKYIPQGYSLPYSDIVSYLRQENN